MTKDLYVDSYIKNSYFFETTIFLVRIYYVRSENVFIIQSIILIFHYMDCIDNIKSKFREFEEAMANCLPKVDKKLIIELLDDQRR